MANATALASPPLPRLCATHPLACFPSSVSISERMCDDACSWRKTQVSLCRSERSFRRTFATQHWHVLHSLHAEDDWLERNIALNVKDESNSLLGMIFGKAAEAFLRTQLDRCSELKILVGGSNRDLLRGQARRLKVIAKGAVYKGICLSDVQLTTSPIHLKYRFLQQPLSISATIRVLEKDLVASLGSHLLSMALRDLFPQSMVSESGASAITLSLEEGAISIMQKNSRSYISHLADPKLAEGQVPTFCLPAALRFEVRDDGQTLHVHSLPLSTCGDTNDAYRSEHIQRMFTLGPKVCITDLKIKKHELHLMGNFLVSPE
ncbi:hypothetical protein O6H91_06G119900 [Diphasiastrum complanatum]|uniref:Uncharacterized protein n=1 Tax=Diphasiastrum complanatum TaxID=34168 RepID=A0ACC2DIY4_DIPCM|nr:hypothetical protein O6H91_06G119900 [Diphasiastrum complanatum]